MARAAVAAPSEPETGTGHSLTRHPPDRRWTSRQLVTGRHAIRPDKPSTETGESRCAFC